MEQPPAGVLDDRVGLNREPFQPRLGQPPQEPMGGTAGPPFAASRTLRCWAEAGAGLWPAPELDQLFFPFSTLIGISFAPGLMSPTFAVISSIPSAYRAAMVFSMTPAGSGMVRENDP